MLVAPSVRAIFFVLLSVLCPGAIAVALGVPQHEAEWTGGELPVSEEAPTLVTAPLLIGLSRPEASYVSVQEAKRSSEIAAMDKDPTLDLKAVGACAIKVSLRDRDTGEPAHSKIQLWRLDQPANQNFARGDLLQAKGDSGEWIEKLPVGRYRLHIEGQPLDATDPPEFEITGPRTALSYLMEKPDEADAYLVVWDEYGQRLTRSAGGMSGGSSWEGVGPPWVAKRHAVRWLGPDFRGGYGWGGSGCGRRLLKASGEHGFALSTVRAPTHGETTFRMGRFFFSKRNLVRVRATYQYARDHVYCAVAIPSAPIYDAIQMNDGTRALDAGAKIKIECKAVLCKPSQFSVSDAPIQISVELKGYRDLEFSLRVGDTIEDVVMELVPVVRSPSESGK